MSTARPGAVLLVTSAAAFLSSLDLFIVNIAFPDIRADFPGTDLGQMSWILNGYTVVFAAFLALAGRLADRFGHKQVFLTGLAVFALASAACAAAPGVWLLVAARAVQAVGAALVMPTSLSLLLAAYPAERRTRAVGAWASIGAVAAALGPPLGGLLVEISWHWVFLVNVPVGIVAFVAGLRVLRDPDVARTGMPDLLGALGIVVGVGALAFALVRTPDSGWGGPEVLVGFAVAVVGLVLVVLRSRRHPVPALDLAVLRVPVVALAALVMVAFTTGFAGMLVVNVLYLTGTWGWSPQLAGLGLAAGPLVVVVVSRLAGHLSGRFGIGPVAFVGTLAFAAGPTWWLTHLGLTPDYLGGMLPGQLLTGLGVGLILPTLSSVVGSALPAASWGPGSSLINTARQVGSVLGVALLVSVIGAHTTGLPSEFGSVRAGWELLAGAALVAAVIALGLSVVERRRRGRGAVVEDLTGADDDEVVVEVERDVRAAVVRGVVRDAGGLAVPGAVATLIDAAGAQLGRARTDADGGFEAALDPARVGPGEHVIVLVSAPEHHPRAHRVPVDGGAALDLALVRRDAAAAA
ncbi:MFS transporter [Actinomycetospora endophytica]|uniref:MFS transporter n=1 Tax=Actinomycetospora endophytica TaxID=2291215 RepID=A0ABS8P572_9PSEU|nr:DHA2 family efflux MFS transporter permease subunit [Actinomycetospora endophytica]MCD2192204.1 MFS transporter [Actinomycetospora endophytica]